MGHNLKKTSAAARPNRRGDRPTTTSCSRWVAACVTVGLAVAGCSSSGTGSGPVLDAQAARGQQAARDRNCTSCHTTSGARSEGPTWKGLYGSAVALTDGTTVTADDAYLTTSIKEPRRQVVRGYQPLMPALKIPDNEVADLVAYIRALK